MLISDLCKKYPVGFRDCIAIAQNRYFMMIPRSTSKNQLEKMAEYFVQIEKNIKELCTLKKFDSLKLADFYNVEHCKNFNCSNYLYLEKITIGSDSVDFLQKFCEKFTNFHSLILFLCSLPRVEKKKKNVDLDREFIRIQEYRTNQ